MLDGLLLKEIKMNIKFIAVMLVLLLGVIFISKSKKENVVPINTVPITVEPVPELEEVPEQEPLPEKVEPKTVNSYQEALVAAKEAKCNIFIYFGAPWCGYCEQMKATTLSSPTVKEKLSKNFVILIINTDVDKATPRKYNVGGIPAYMVINSDGNVLRKTTGYKDSQAFLKWLGNK